jgi:coenzyme F420 hydrogenase subunit beta
MNKNAEELFKTVINNDFCSGCGACSIYNNSPFYMKFDENGRYIPFIKKDIFMENQNSKFPEICPFSDYGKNEDQIGELLFSNTENIKRDISVGYYLKNYAGHVIDDNIRETSSSGGIGTWIAEKILGKGLADYIIHVKPTEEGNKILFSYQISKTVEEIKKGVKSKYYPIEMSQVIKHVLENPGRYVFYGVPCFIKAIRLLSENDKIIKERIKYTIGLVCGHLKTDMFAKSMAWEMGIKPDELSTFDFRVKSDKRSSNYGVKASSTKDGKIFSKFSLSKDLFVSNWGHGLFKLNACDYCDDVVAETADISIGDAWLPEYTKDNLGNNIIIVRNTELLNIILENKNEFDLKEITVEDVYRSQAGGFRHKKEGLEYRLFIKDIKNEWRPKKRVKAKNGLSSKRKKIYEKRIQLKNESFFAFKKAVVLDEFDIFKELMNPIIKDYDKYFKTPFFIKLLRKIQGLFYFIYFIS